MINKLFVYGIFLGEGMRRDYGMSNPKYAVVEGYATVGIPITGLSIVEAVPSDDSRKGSPYCLTGLLVDVDPLITRETIFGKRVTYNTWEQLDALEGAYKRIKVDTTGGEECWMYVAK